MSNEIYTQLNYGQVYIRRKGSTLPPFPMGPMANVSFTPELEEITIKDPRTLSNSELDGVSRPAGGTVTGDLLELPPETMTELLAATRTEVPTGTITDEDHSAVIGRTSMTVRLPLAVTEITNVAGDVTYLPNVDYVKMPGGIRWVDGGALATDIAGETADADGIKSLPVKVTYTFPKVGLIQAFTRGRQFYEVFVSTVNEAGQLTGRRVTFHRARLALSGELPLINRDDFAQIGVTLALSEDPDRFGLGESAMMTVEEEAV
ncbi:MAG: hypothetical protein KJ989_15260 [Gammaproteobacteria bacterium]|uniref:Putative tail protein n=1 Tax=viral metagenome TaxID=1070528 RepID=A0A6M3J790_9ZZZZ|nr:hypothetical protein [Gammaproteobacteria bacterium]MBU2067476.1 hypothetical protein [Gammaproteobacteria bacterium]MBU2139486.1 hypothetical protein [Gammaproteobacteria bacterium]MBU2255913.1 hypothetical protein [Gammaproteobacteria bacterium]MBU2295558.1 hypothetical protein [Gammaproteobacteria bacterium]